jgi:4-amino-4-deoxy-L-arabinose transferase-like glycosyltransferase
MRSLTENYRAFCQTRWLWAIVLVAALLFTASANYMSLKSYDDCFYARKGLELYQRGEFFTVTWGDRPDFQYPSLQFWIVGRSFALLGRNDFAARLPSILMALAIMLMTYRVGRVMVGKNAAMVAVAVLLLTPLFVTNARRCQTEIPLAFWTTLAMLIYVEGLARPKLHALIAIPLGAAVLTKSVLGLFPLVVVPAAIIVPALRKSLRNAWLWLGLVVGLALGASWSIHQYLNFGEEFMSFHYGTMVMSRTAGEFNLAGVFTDYPMLLLEHYQPIILPAVAGLVLFLFDRVRRRRTDVQRIESGRLVGAHDERRSRSSEADLLVVWALLPAVLYSFSSLRHYRYLFPLLPVYGIFTGYLLATRVKKWVAPVCCYVVPGLTIISTFIFWFAPGLYAGDNNQVFKQEIEAAREELEPGTTLPYVGEEYWPEANPFLYYWDVKLEKPGDTVDVAIAKALNAPHRSLVCNRGWLGEVAATGVPQEIVVEGKGWAWIRFPREGKSTPTDDVNPMEPQTADESG